MVESLSIGEWTLRMRPPERHGSYRLILMLHGWTGNEDVMWVFASRLPDDAYLVSPRGLYTAAGSGFSWHSDLTKAWVDVDDFRPAMEAIWQLLVPENFPDADLSTIGLVGFSQGAALAYSLALTSPARVCCLAGLAGFMPGNTERLVARQPLKGKAVFVAHGSRDDIVGMDRAYHAVRTLETAGAQVTGCFDDVGHKLGASCFRGLESYFQRCWPVPQSE
jgi:phospholipase/carboxylesterase